MIVQKHDDEIRTTVVDFHAKLAPGETLLPGAVVTVNDPALTAVLVSTAESAVTARVSGAWRASATSS